MENLLEQRVTGELKKVIGSKLVEVELLCLDYERDEEDIQQTAFTFAGEVILQFSDKKIFITWDENAGWKDHFSLHVGKDSAYLPDSIFVKWNVAKFDPWKKAVGKELTSAKVYGFAIKTGSHQMDAPHFVELDFEGYCIFVGEGYAMYPNPPIFGDGDDMIVMTELSDKDRQERKLMWSS
ncbi:MAG: hypothetical protein AAF889_10235 [Cyanobacteria bacterium P01_D01_bin.73]